MRVSSSVLGALLLAGADARCVMVRPPAAVSNSTAVTTAASIANSFTVTPIPTTSGEASPTTEASAEKPATTESSAAPTSARASASQSSPQKPVPAASSSSSAATIKTSATSAVPTTTALTSSAVPKTSVSSAAASKASSTSSSAAAAPTSPSSNFARNPAYPADIVDQLRDASIGNLETYSQSKLTGGACTIETASIRREWSDLAPAEREAYTSAVKCLQKLPTRSDKHKVPGARSRFDDFMATHITMTPYVHDSANFLAWHRLFVWTYEKALREECGYEGYQPYWNWDRYAADPINSPMFNGNASSMSGSSEPGSGCVETGPFADMKVNLGPGTSLEYNPRCLRRDVSRSNAQECVAAKTLPVITRSQDIGTFQNTLQSFPGIHANGHFTVGGDPGGDIRASAGEPMFYLHHAMIDRVWWLWQLQDLPARLNAVAGRDLLRNRPGALGDALDLGVLGDAGKLGDMLATLGGKGGEFCYIYL